MLSAVMLAILHARLVCVYTVEGLMLVALCTIANVDCLPPPP